MKIRHSNTCLISVMPPCIALAPLWFKEPRAATYYQHAQFIHNLNDVREWTLADKSHIQIVKPEWNLTPKASHNHDSPFDAFVRLLARHAAEADFLNEEHQMDSPDIQGDEKWASTLLFMLDIRATYKNKPRLRIRYAFAPKRPPHTVGKFIIVIPMPEFQELHY